MGSFSVLFANIRKNLLKYLFFTLPCILAFKAIYLCWTDEVLTFAYFIQQFLSNVPFWGQTFSEYMWGNNLILSLDEIQTNQKITQLIFVGGLGSCLGKSLSETWFSDYFNFNFNFNFKIPAVAGPADIGGDFASGKTPSIKIPLTLQSTQGSDLNLGSDSASSNVPEQGTANVPQEGSANDISPHTEPQFLWESIVDKFNNNMVPTFEQYVGLFKKMNSKNLAYTLEVPKNNQDPDITEVNLAQSFFVVLKYQADMLIRSSEGRDKWLRELRYYLSDHDKVQIEEISDKLDQARDDFINKIESLIGSDPDKLRVEIKQFFDYTNTYRNNVKKELSKADGIMRKGLKEHPIFEKKEIKKMINSDYPKTLKAFYDEDNYLKRKIMEKLNEAPKPKGEK
jgi:hypothetical protein